ncbi:MAG: NAD(P)-dependent glycerol-3-phosphate dehydrogenase [Nitrospirae bacterium]|nr:NAD(P)-dependent glycerol-3-phosphate dehydrogenase [Nitrospirota bacterium]
MAYKISVIGAGSWGTVLANHLGAKGYAVTLWAYEKEVVEAMRTSRRNVCYMPGLPLSENVAPTDDLRESVADADVILLVVPTQFVRRVIEGMADYIKPQAMLVTAAKGIEKTTLKTVSQIIRELTGNFRAVISGPSFAEEVSKKKPTAITLGVEDEQRGHALQEVFNTGNFRVYTHDDLVGIELGGALKNVIAIASGICDGLDLGLNARAALITRGLAEMVRLGQKMGAKERTFSGLSGLGDLVLTCTGNLSRNYSVGVSLGKGQSLTEILSEMKAVAEGVETSYSAYELSRAYSVEMPIVEQVYRVLHDGKNPGTAVHELMTRELKKEF